MCVVIRLGDLEFSTCPELPGPMHIAQRHTGSKSIQYQGLDDDLCRLIKHGTDDDDDNWKIQINTD